MDDAEYDFQMAEHQRRIDDPFCEERETRNAIEAMHSDLKYLGWFMVIAFLILLFRGS